MRLLSFELKKLWKQKKIYWLLLLIAISVGWLFYSNYSVYEEKEKRALEITETYQNDINNIRRELEELRRQDAIEIHQEQQLDMIVKMNSSLLPWKYAIGQGQWERIPELRGEFLQFLQEYASLGGEFPSLEGIELEIAIKKNDWFIEHGLPYEDEAFPVSPHLFVQQLVAMLFGIIGLSGLLLLFGNIVTIEKEQKTTLTLKTQPVRRWQQTLSKMGSLLFVQALFVGTVLVLSIVIPLIFTEYKLVLTYPQVLVTNGEVSVIPISTFLAKSVGMFSVASWFAFALVLFMSNWIRESFTMLVNIAFLLGTILVATEFFPALQSILNPFAFFSSFREEMVQGEIVVYFVSTILWCCILLALSIYFHDKELGLLPSSGEKTPFQQGKTQAGQSKLRNILIFEWRKLVRRKLFFQTNVVLLLLVFMGYYLLAQQSLEKEQAFIQNVEGTIEFYNNFTGALKIYKEEAERNEEHREFYEELIKEEELKIAYYKEYQALMRDALAGYHNNEWDKFYEYLLHHNRVINQEEGIYKLSKIVHDYASVGRFTVGASIDEKLWMMEKNVRPIFPGYFIPTMHHYFQKDETDRYEDYIEANTKVDHSGLYSLYLLFQHHVHLAPMLLLLFLLGGGLATERGKKRTLSLLKTLPIAEKQLFFGKVLHSSMIATLNIFGLFSLVLLIATIFNRFGDWYYPILKYHSFSYSNSEEYTGSKVEGYGYEFLPLGEYLFHTIALTILVMLFLLTFTILLSVLLKNILSVFATSGILLVAGYVLTTQFLTEKAHLSPFTYFNIPKITNGELATIIDNQKINIVSGSAILSLTSIAFIILGYGILRFKNKKNKIIVDSGVRM
ncbi:ABC transporter permease subunit [Bacillus sp. FJAT-45066]|uniref:ABC transporter permease subunit n=1 Tax=Bacillus sp. FJAT-45066 TaxID=2011010 RepID=UPI000BB6AA62|nr:ABC transporter permease subunit [Bacillus sp. FJAT-45066]